MFPDESNVTPQGSLSCPLPLPIPLTNTFPGWVIILIAAGLLERDGAFVAAGYGMFAAGVVFFTLLGGATHHLIDAIRRGLGG